MYLGRIVEQGKTAEVLDTPLHPYTKLLRDSSPVPDPTARLTLTKIMGEVPSPANPPPGCTFHPRCPLAVERCRTEAPALREARPDRRVACHLV